MQNTQYFTNQDLCKQCGKCCMAICLNYPMEHVSNKVNELTKEGILNTDCHFILENWVEISEEEASKRNPEIDLSTKCYWYKCTKLDEKTNKCTVHDNRPHVCSGFPNYRSKKLPKGFPYYTKDCGYII